MNPPNVIERCLAAIAFARAIDLHPLASKTMKPYKVRVSRRKAIALDHWLQQHQVTLSAMVEAALDEVAWMIDHGEDLKHLDPMIQRARAIDESRKSRRAE